MYGGRIIYDTQLNILGKRELSPKEKQLAILYYVTCYIYIKGITSQRNSPLISSKALRIADKVKECGKNEIRIGCCQGYKSYPVFCGIRICRNPGCIAARDKKTVEKYYGFVASMVSPVFVTLTLRYHHDLGYAPKSRLDKAFNSLVRYYKAQKDPSGRPVWGGYIKCLEIEPKEDGFFYHLHIIYDGVEISKTILSAKWSQFTSDSYIVDVRSIWSREEAVAYVTKYVTKAINIDLSIMDYLKVRKMRFLSSWGCVNRLKPQRQTCPVCGGYFKVIF